MQVCGCAQHATTTNTNTNMKSIQCTLLATSLLGFVSANAEPTGLLFGKLSGDTAFDRTWSAFKLYKNEDNPILQEFALQGRLQVQSIYGESDGDSFNTSDYKDADNDESVWGNDIEARRARFGFKSKWFQSWKFDGQINVDVDGMDKSKDGTLYKDLYDLVLTYAPSDALNINAGKTKVKFSREQEISSKEIFTVERSLVSNTLFPGELTGAWVNGKGIADYWLYEFGVYGADKQREFSNLDNGSVILAKIGYDYSSQADLESAVVMLHYMHNTKPGFQETASPEYGPGSSPKFTDSIALTNEISQGRFGLMTEAMYGFGFNGTASVKGANKKIAQSDVFGISIIPSYYLNDGFQLVGRLQLATAPDKDGLQVPGRYEQLVSGDDEKGNTYASAYAGLNYYMYGHKLKLMNGLEYSHMGGGEYDGYTFMSALRFSF